MGEGLGFVFLGGVLKGDCCFGFLFCVLRRAVTTPAMKFAGHLEDDRGSYSIIALLALCVLIQVQKRLLQ